MCYRFHVQFLIWRTETLDTDGKDVHYMSMSEECVYNKLVCNIIYCNIRQLCNAFCNENLKCIADYYSVYGYYSAYCFWVYIANQLSVLFSVMESSDGKTSWENMDSSLYIYQRSKVEAKHFPSCGICSGMFGLETAPAGHLEKKRSIWLLWLCRFQHDIQNRYYIKLGLVRASI